MGQQEIIHVLKNEYNKDPARFHPAMYIAKHSKMNIANCIKAIKKLLVNGVLVRDLPCSYRIKVKLNPQYLSTLNQQTDEVSSTREHSKFDN